VAHKGKRRTKTGHTTQTPQPHHNHITLLSLWCDTTLDLIKKHSDRTGTARRAMLVNSCYVSRAMEGFKQQK